MSLANISGTVCKICNKKQASYTCPRCQAPYCTLACYKSEKHQQCSEKFYEQNVLEELQATAASKEEKQAMVDMLRQFEEDCAADEQEMLAEEKAAELASRLSGIDLDGNSQKIWEKLTQEERTEFTKLVKDQNFTSLVQEWLPWWSYRKDEKPLVVDATEETIPEDLSCYNFPEINTSLKPFSSISKSPPSHCLKYNTVNILLGYVYMTLRYNGEHHSMAVQCAEDLVSLSDVLLSAANHQSTDEAVRSSLASLKQLDDLYISLEYFGSAVDAVVDVITGPDHQPSIDYLLMAVSDILKLLNNARKELKSDPDGADGQKKLLLMKKKVEFYCSWILSYGLMDLPGLIIELLSSRDTLLQERDDDITTDKLRKKVKEQTKPKIEILTQ